MKVMLNLLPKRKFACIFYYLNRTRNFLKVSIESASLNCKYFVVKGDLLDFSRTVVTLLSNGDSTRKVSQNLVRIILTSQLKFEMSLTFFIGCGNVCQI